MNRYLKRIIIGTFIVPLLGFLYILGVMYFYDPLQLFSEKYPGYYHEDTRLAAKRVIDNYEFDGIFMGSSMFFMSNPSEINFGKFINISLKGSNVKERSEILDYAFKYKNIKHVIYTLDGIGDSNIYKKNIEILYESKNINLNKGLKIYLNGIIPYKCFFIFSKSPNCIGKPHDFKQELGRFKKDDHAIKKLDFNIEINKNINKNLSKQIEFLNKYLIKYINEYTQTQFYLILPPYSTIYYKEYLYQYIYENKQYIQFFDKYKNVKIFFFGNEDFADNLNNYGSDFFHYEHWINSIINKAINENKNVITIYNMDSELNKFMQKVINYDSKAYKEALK